jgi:hypothetical protein
LTAKARKPLLLFIKWLSTVCDDGRMTETTSLNRGREKQLAVRNLLYVNVCWRKVGGRGECFLFSFKEMIVARKNKTGKEACLKKEGSNDSFATDSVRCRNLKCRHILAEPAADRPLRGV